MGDQVLKQHELYRPFLILCESILTIWKKFMTDDKIKELINNSWNKFVKDYKPMSSVGYLIIGKGKNDPDGLFFFYERTFGKPEERIKEWGDRHMHNSAQCADTIFGEKFSHYLLNEIRIVRHQADKNKSEIEWFNMTGLNWDDVSTILNNVCTFVSTIKQIRPAKTININTASIVQIKQLPLIGNKLANRIIEARNIRPFSNINDLKRRVDKIGDRICNAFKEFITFEMQENNENQLININTDPENIIKELPKIGNKLAKNIVEYRKNQLLVDKNDLLKIPGIGPKTYSAIKDLIRI